MENIKNISDSDQTSIDEFKNWVSGIFLSASELCYTGNNPNLLSIYESGNKLRPKLTPSEVENYKIEEVTHSFDTYDTASSNSVSYKIRRVVNLFDTYA
jgi:hypothetical protein